MTADRVVGGVDVLAVMLDDAECAKRRRSEIDAEYSDDGWDLSCAASAAVGRMIGALQEIASVGDGYGPHNPPTSYAGTTGEGHAKCREIATAALANARGAK